MGGLREVEGFLRKVLLPITNAYFRDRTAEESSLQEAWLREIIGNAMKLAAKISQQASKLVIIDKEWFQENGRQLVPSDDRMKDRLGDGDNDNPRADLMVDLILTPGFLKYGNDNAEYLDQYSVWMPAKVDVRDYQGGNTPPASGETHTNEQVKLGDGQDLALSPPTDLLGHPGNEEL